METTQQVNGTVKCGGKVPRHRWHILATTRSPWGWSGVSQDSTEGIKSETSQGPENLLTYSP